MEENIVIGIEGYVGVGKTAISKEMLKYIPNSIVFHAGNLYRAIVYGILKSGMDFDSLKKNLKNIDIKELMDRLKIKIIVENRQTEVFIGNNKIKEDELQSPQISIAVSTVSRVANNKKAYEVVRNILEKLKKEYNVIFSGRDIMRIYPNVNYHLFLTASLEERIKRKSMIYNKKITSDEVRKNIEERDKLQKEAGYYDIFEKTKIRDLTECANLKESTEKVLENIDYSDFKFLSKTKEEAVV